ncbi:MAG: hypothetical protein CYPHOPRED_003661 [Cyphobasidiales sp. Tagirdzhanova-0007]|nr:MAG: hypothetical protein CYPHOPRED_003661 [Cyphobasidiales sp. Tagirdzhanova-0007]
MAWLQGYGDAYPPSLSYDNSNMNLHQYGASTDSFGGDPFADGRAPKLPYHKKYSDADGASKEALTAGMGSAGAKQKRGAWMEGGKEPASPSSWKRWTIIGIVALLVLGGAAGGLVAWKLQSDKKNANPESSQAGGTLSSASKDPSSFTKDDRLHPSFYGVAYTPRNVQMPTCGAIQDNVTAEIQIISQLTTRIRTYGSDCNQTSMILQGIQDAQVNITSWLGVYVDGNDTTWERQMGDTLSAIKTYGTDHISGIIVGNEYILDQSASAASYSLIEEKVATFRTALDALDLSKTLSVGTADAGSVMSKALDSHLDFSMANVHPWFGGVPINQAAGWTWEYFEQNDVSVAGNAIPYIAETGWPTESMTKENATLGAAVAGVSELQTFLDTFVCQANVNQTRYFYFEVFDEPWKEMYGGVEPYWGLFTADRALKDITIPDCLPTAS